MTAPKILRRPSPLDNRGVKLLFLVALVVAIVLLVPACGYDVPSNGDTRTVVIDGHECIQRYDWDKSVYVVRSCDWGGR